MEQEELQNLLVRLVGDPSAYFKMLDGAVDKTQEAVGKMTNAITSIGAALGVAGAFEMYSNLERTTIRLGATIRASGRDVEAITSDYKAWAAQMSATTLTGKTAALELLQQAEAFGLTGEKAKQAAKAAISLGAIKGVAPGQTIGALAAFLNTGDTRRLSFLIPTLRGIKDEGEKVAMVQKILSAGWGAAQDLVDTGSGALTRLGQTMKGFLMEAGKAVSERIKPLVQWLTQMIRALDESNPAFKGAVGSALAFLGIMLILRPAIFGVSKAIDSIRIAIRTLTGLLSWPRLLAVAGLAIAAALIRQHFGSWEKAWDAIKEKAQVVWGYLKAYWNAFVQWARPYWNTFTGWLEKKWLDFSAWAEQAWEKTREKALAFVVWARPIFRALVDFFLSWWGFLAKGAIAVWGVISKVVGKVASWIGEKLGMAFDRIDWNKVRLNLLILLASAIFFFENFGKYMDLTVLSWKAGWETMKNTVLFLFTDQIPAALSWFRDHWKDMLVFMFNTWQLYNNAMGESLIQTFKNLPALIQGKMQLQDVLAPVFKDFSAKMQAQMGQLASTLPEIPVRQMTELEKRLHEEYLAQQRQFIESWGDFTKRKIREWTAGGGAIAPEAVEEMKRKADKAGTDVGGGFAEHFKRETDKLEAHLKGSAEAIAAVREYLDRLNEHQEAGKAGAEGGKGGPEATAPSPTPTPGPTAADKILASQDAVVDALRAVGKALYDRLGEPLPRTVVGGKNGGPNIKPAPPLDG